MLSFDEKYCLDTFRALLGVDSTTGQYEMIEDALCEILDGMGYPYKRTRKGGVIVDLGGEGDALVVTAHLDDIGLMVRHVNSDGTLNIADGWMVRSGDNADSTDWRWRDERVSSCQSHHYAQISPCNLHEQEYQGEHKVWSDTIKSDNDATHSHTCLACNGDANIQNHNIAASWTWANSLLLP